MIVKSWREAFSTAMSESGDSSECRTININKEM